MAGKSTDRLGGNCFIGGAERRFFKVSDQQRRRNVNRATALVLLTKKIRHQRIAAPNCEPNALASGRELEAILQSSGLRLALLAHKHGRVTNTKESQGTGKLTHAARRNLGKHPQTTTSPARRVRPCSVSFLQSCRCRNEKYSPQAQRWHRRW